MANEITVSRGERVELRSSSIGPRSHDNFRVGERGAIVHIFKEGSYGFGYVIIELSGGRRPRVSLGEIRKLNALDYLAEV